MSFSQIYPTLWSDSGNSKSNILAKFPYLCDLTPMAKALEDSGLVADTRKNPNSYDKWQLALEIAEYLDEHLDYATGKEPDTISEAYNSGYIMSQAEFWSSMNRGIYTIEADGGYGATGTTLTFAGHHYTTAPTITIAEDPTGTYLHSSLTAKKPTITATLSTSSDLDYADFTDDANVSYANIKTQYSSVSSDDIIGISWQLSGVNTVDPSGTSISFPYAYPFSNSPSGSAQQMQRVGSRTAPDVYFRDFSDLVESDSDIQAEFANLPSVVASDGLSGTPTKTSFTNIKHGAPSNTAIVPTIHFAESAGITSYSRNMLGDSGDVNPTFALAAPHFDDKPLTWVGPASYTDFDITAMYAEDGSQMPATATIDDYKLYGEADTAYGTAERLIAAYGVTGLWWDYYNGQNSSAARQHIKIDTSGNSFQIKRGSDNMQVWGIPIYRLVVRYTDSSVQYTKTYTIPFMYMADFTLTNTHVVPLIHENGVGVTGNMTAIIKDIGNNDVGITGYKTYASVASLSIDDPGAGYTDTQTITGTMNVPEGRFWQSIYGGKKSTTRTNNGTTNSGSTATLSITAGRLPREVDIVTHGSVNMGVESYDYKIRGFLGTDKDYEKQEFAKRFTLNGSNLITGITNTGETETATLGQPSAPGYEYDTDTYHDEQNEHGSNTSYMAHSFGTGEADERWFNKEKGTFDVAISNGVVTGFTARNRDDNDGTTCAGGWDYDANDDYTPLSFIRDTSVALPDGYIEPSVYIRTTTDADNGEGKKATIDISNADLEFFPGKNVPDGAYLYAMAFGSGYPAFITAPDETYTTSDYTGRLFGDTGMIQPSSVKLVVERPNLQTETRSLRTQVIATGAHRYTFEFSYPPMSQSDAEVLISRFDRYKENEIYLYIPRKAIKHLGDWTYNTEKTMSKKPEIIGGGSLGSSEILVDGHEEYGTPIPVGTHFTIQGSKKIYQIVKNASVDQYGRAEYDIEPPLLIDASNFYLDTDRGSASGADHMRVRAFFIDDQLDYSVDAAGIYRFNAIKFRESL